MKVENFDDFDMVSEKCNIPVDFNVSFLSPCKRPEGKEHLGDSRLLKHYTFDVVNKIIDYYNSVFGWIKANPQDEELNDAIKSVYIFSDKENTDPNNYVNTKIGHTNFLSALQDKKSQTIFILGKKGIGKTFYLNYFINTISKKFCIENKLVWYRIDGSKIFRKNIEIKHSNPDNLEYISLKDYLYVHITYVTFKYKKKVPIFERFFEYFDSLDAKQIFRDWNADHKSEKFDNKEKEILLHHYSESVKAIEEQLNCEELTKEHQFEILSDPTLKNISSLIAKIILRYFQSEKYRPIIMLDGIDNIDYYHHSDIYKIFISQLDYFSLQDDIDHPFSFLVIMTLRNDTYEHLRYSHKEYFRSTIIEYQLKKNKFYDIIKKKSEVAVNPECKYFQSLNKEIHYEDNYSNLTDEEKSKIKWSSLNEYNEIFVQYCRDYFDNMKYTFTKNIPDNSEYLKQLLINDKLFDYLFNDNLRNFINNFLNSFKYMTFWETNRKERSKYKEYLYTESLLLNGNMYLDSTINKSEFGHCIFNIFWFDSNNILGYPNWHGLCMLRILQYLKRYTSTKKVLFKSINSTFKYNLEVIKERFKTAIENGLIESSFDIEKDLLVYDLTNKGKIFLEFPFFDINLFYYYALDVPLSKLFLEDSKLIAFHSSTPKYWYNFNEACVLTSISLIRHIITQHDIEIKKYGINEAIYQLPVFFPDHLIYGIIKHINVLEKSDRIRYEELMKKIEGIW